MFLAYLTTAVITFIALYMPINPWCYLLSSIPVLLSGGSCSLITGIYCYLTDTTNASDRALRYEKVFVLTNLIVGISNIGCLLWKELFILGYYSGHWQVAMYIILHQQPYFSQYLLEYHY